MLVGTSEQSLYSTAQINQYLSRIAFPSNKYPRAELQLVQTDGGLSYLEKLMKYQLSAIPFENLSLHYSQNPGVSLDSDEIFFKIIEKHRGGYCMELNFLFGRILKSSEFKREYLLVFLFYVEVRFIKFYNLSFYFILWIVQCRDGSVANQIMYSGL